MDINDYKKNIGSLYRNKEDGRLRIVRQIHFDSEVGHTATYGLADPQSIEGVTDYLDAWHLVNGEHWEKVS